MQTSDSIDQIAGAIASAQTTLEAATKSNTNPAFRSKYADLTEILNVARPALASHGVAIIQSPEYSDGSVNVVTMLAHTSGQWIKTECGLPIEKQTPQGAGSAITYARRYSLAAALGISQEDDDGNAASQKPTPPPVAPKPTPPPQGSTQPAPPSPAHAKRMGDAMTAITTALKSPAFSEEEVAAYEARATDYDKGPDGKALRNEKNASYLENLKAEIGIALHVRAPKKASDLAAFQDDIPESPQAPRDNLSHAVGMLKAGIPTERNDLF